MGETSSIQWNKQIRLVLSDVDETIADVYTSAEPAMVYLFLGTLAATDE